MRLKVKRFDKKYCLPEYTPGSACFDLTCRETVTILPGEIKAVRQNVAIQIPNGYALLLFSRSSTPLKKGLMVANGVGVVDPFYCGDEDENMAFLLNITKQPITVSEGDKLVQGMIIKTSPVAWEEVDKMNALGHGGYQHL